MHDSALRHLLHKTDCTPDKRGLFRTYIHTYLKKHTLLAYYGFIDGPIFLTLMKETKDRQQEKSRASEHFKSRNV